MLQASAVTTARNKVTGPSIAEPVVMLSPVYMLQSSAAHMTLRGVGLCHGMCRFSMMCDKGTHVLRWWDSRVKF